MFNVDIVSNTGVQLAPALVVFHTPPDAAPTYHISWLLFTTSMLVMRPLIPAGPMLRGFKFLSWLMEMFCALSTEMANRKSKVVNNLIVKVLKE